MTRRTSRALQFEFIISDVLQWGVLTSLAFLALGTLLAFGQGNYGKGGGGPVDLQQLLQGTVGFHHSMKWLGRGLLTLRGSAIIMCGLLILIATPVLRVAISVVAFALEKDRPYVAITMTVLLLLIASFALGGVG